MTSPLHRAAAHAAAALIAAAAARPAAAQNAVKFENYVATTVNLSEGAGETVRINVARWSADEDRDRLTAALQEKGDAHLLEAIPASAPSAGYVWARETLGYSLRYAYRQRLPNGGERVILLTDRPLGSWTNHPWKANTESTAPDYPFTLIELRLNANGSGEGKTSFTTKVVTDESAHMIALQDFEHAPVVLKDVKRQTDSRRTAR